TDAAGGVTRYLYNPWGGHTARIDPAGQLLAPMHVEPETPDPLDYELPDTPAEWEYGSLLELDRAEQENVPGQMLAPFRQALAKDALRKIEHRQPSLEHDAQGRLIQEIDSLGVPN